MARPKSNQKLTEYLLAQSVIVEEDMKDAVEQREFLDAAIYKRWSECLIEALNIINQSKEGKIEKTVRTDERSS